MKDLKNRKTLFAVMMLLALFAGCKGEDPTAPPPSSGPGTGGGAPPVGASIALTVANPTPLANSSTTITATVTVGGQPVPNGTAVEFGTTFGLFTDTGSNLTIKTTTNGQATATLGASSAGTANVTAVVNNVVARTTVTFQAGGTTTPPPDTTTPVITSVTPNTGRPEGGDIITIVGRNFRAPVRVFFDVGGGRLLEGQVASVTGTQVQVLTPRVDLGAGQTLAASIVLFNEAGTPSETRVTASAAFTFRRAILTPVIVAVSPDTGPIDGGTRITIFGEGFEAPVQVALSPGATGGAQGWHQIEVINVTFNQIIAVTPPARDIIPTGSGTLTGPVDLRVLNINSATEVVASVVFRYTAAMQITGIRPLAGTSLGGTDVTIDGIGFNAPVDVFIGGVLAQTIRVSGSQILARTSGLASPCASTAGPVTVTNIENGDTAASTSTFSFIAVNPLITGVTPNPVTPGTTITVNVLDPGVGPLGNAFVRFTVNGIPVTPTPQVITQGTGTVPFTMVVPTTGFQFPTVVCTTSAMTEGTQLGPITVSVAFTNATTGCSTILENGLIVNPPGPNTCLQPPTALTSAPPCPTGVVIPPTSATDPATGTGQFTISNAPASRPLTVGAPAATATNATVTVTPATAQTVAAGTTTPPYTITVNPTAAGAFSGSVTFTTNDPARPTLQVCFSGTATP